MSAYIVNRETIAALVEAAARGGAHQHSMGLTWIYNRSPGGNYNRGRLECMDYAEAKRVGQMLWDENVRSVKYRYKDSRREVQENLPGPIDCTYQYGDPKSLTATRHDPVVILKLIDCYSYQACEHPEWEASEAFAFVNALRHKMIGCLQGYDDAPWGLPA
jgi:hypothetical protein